MRVLRMLRQVCGASSFRAPLPADGLDYARSAKVQHLLVWGGTMSFIRAATASLREEDLVFEGDLDFESLGRPWHVYRLAAR